MTGTTFQNISSLLNKSGSFIPLIDKSDLTPLTEIMAHLEQIQAVQEAPSALSNLASRACKLCEHLIMAETPFESGCKKLTTIISKMSKAMDDISLNQMTFENVNHDDALEQESAAASTSDDQVDAADDDDFFSSTSGEEFIEDLADDLVDLVVKFASQQKPVLEDFEAHILEYENGDEAAKGAIKRILHTWKGEFGVLNLPDYSGFIHSIEETVEKGMSNADVLFRLKDLLSAKFDSFAEGKPPRLTAEDIASMELPPAEETSASEIEESVSEEKTAEPVSTNVAGTSPVVVQDIDLGLIQADPSLITDFITEAYDHIHSVETQLLDLENDRSSKEHINAIFRACHTIKGAAGFLGLKNINKLSHSTENLMDKARKDELQLEEEHIDLLLASMDCLKELLESLQNTLNGDDYVVPDTFLTVMEKLHVTLETGIPDAAPEDGSGNKIGEILVKENVVTPGALDKALEEQGKGDGRKIGQILIDQSRAKPKDVAKALVKQNAARKSTGIEDTIRVPIGRLDQLIDSIGEAVIAQSMIAADPVVMGSKSQELEKKTSQANLIMRQVQELSMALRMVSIKSTFQKMARLVRDLSKKSGKDIEFHLDGEDTELDKSVVENIGDPLMHMVRNSIDHGIESDPAAREAAGKTRKAHVTLRAFHKAGSIYIEIEDDGRGINKEAVIEKAINQGLISPESSLTDQEIFQLIFRPGFSTAQKVTDISGRGVGMDVVKRNIEALRGSIDIQSEQGKGTVFSIRLPLTLAIIDGMIVRCRDENFIIPTLSIIESLTPGKNQVERVLGKGELLKVRGELLNFIRLDDLFGMGTAISEERESAEDGAVALSDCVAIVVEDMMGKRIALLVNEILGQQQVVIKSMGDALSDIQGVSGCAIMSDGGVCLILDVGGIVKMTTE